MNHASHRNRLLDLALADNNDFIRYLAARYVYEVDEEAKADEQARYAKILNDASPLARINRTEFEAMKWLNYEPEAFWATAPSWRLAAVTGVEHEGEEFSKLLAFALGNLFPENTGRC